MYQPTTRTSNCIVMHTDTVKGLNKESSSSLLSTLQHNKQVNCPCSKATTSHIQTSICIQQQQHSRSNGYFDGHKINNTSQLYSQHSFIDSVHTNNNGLLPEHDNTLSDYSANVPSSPIGAGQILMILMCNGMTSEFDQFNDKFKTPHNYFTNRLRIESNNTISNYTTPTSSASTTPSSSISSPNCNDNPSKSLLDISTLNNTISQEKSNVYDQPILCTNVKSTRNTHIDELISNQDQYIISESSNKLDENLTLPPSPCVSDVSSETEQVRNLEESIEDNQTSTAITTTTNTTTPTTTPTCTTEQKLIPHKIESVIHHDSTDLIPNTDLHGETTDESSDEENAPKTKKQKTETLIPNKDPKTMKPELQLDSVESSGLTNTNIKPTKYYSFRDATIYVLSQIGKPMSAVDITKYIFDQKMVKSEGKTPERTVAAMIYQEMKKKKSASEFALFGSGIFGLSAWKSDDHTSQDTASVSTDASLSSQKSVDRTKKKKEKKKRKLSKSEELSEPESDNEPPIPTRKPRRMNKPKPSSIDEDSIDSEQVTCNKKRKSNPEEDVVITEESLFKTYISKLKKKEQDQIDEDECFVCKNGGELVCCDYTGCMKVYHPSCVGLNEVPQGDWICPHHYCSECKKQSVKKCFTCPFSVCDEHVSLLKDKIDMEKYVCKECKPLCDHTKQ